MLLSSIFCLMHGALGISNVESFAKHHHRRHAEVSRIEVAKTMPLPAAALRDYSYRSRAAFAADSNQASLAPISTVALDDATLSGLPGYDVLPGASSTATPGVDVSDDTATTNVDQAALDAATASAKAIADAAEAEAAQGDAESTAPTDAPTKPSIAVFQRMVKKQMKSVNATGEAQTSGSDEASRSENDGADDDSDDYDAEAPTTMAPMPGDELESLTPQGKVESARQRLQDNLHRQAEIAAAIAEQGNDTDFERRVDEQASIIANETQTKSFASVLGTIRKEMRKFASPFYMEHLISEQRHLKSVELELEAALEKAEAGLQGRVMESHFQPSSTALRGGEAMFAAKKVTVPAKFDLQESAATRRTTWAVTAVAHTMLLVTTLAQ